MSARVGAVWRMEAEEQASMTALKENTVDGGLQRMRAFLLPDLVWCPDVLLGEMLSGRNAYL